MWRTAKRDGWIGTMIAQLRFIGVLPALMVLPNEVAGQEAPSRVRFVATGAMEDVRWQGAFERLTTDSLYIRVRVADTMAAFSRTTIRSVERDAPTRAGRTAGIGCLVLGTALGAQGYFGTHDPDSPGLENRIGVLSFVVGCAVGAFFGPIVSGNHGEHWQPWVLPDSLVAPTSRPVRM